MQLLYTCFPHLSSEISIKMVDFSKKVSFSPIFSSNHRHSPMVSNSIQPIFTSFPGSFAMFQGTCAVHTGEQRQPHRKPLLNRSTILFGMVGPLPGQSGHPPRRGIIAPSKDLFRQKRRKPESNPFFSQNGLAFCAARVYSYRVCCMGVSRFRLDTLNVNCIPRMIVGLVNHRSIQ